MTSTPCLVGPPADPPPPFDYAMIPVYVFGACAAALSLVVATGCNASLEPAKAATNEGREAGHEVAAILHKRCTLAYGLVKTQEEFDDLRSKCRPAFTAYDLFRTAHISAHSVITSVEAGQCVGVSRSSENCNVLGAFQDLIKAQIAVIETISHIPENTK